MSLPRSLATGQRGISVVMAIFLLLLFGLISALMATMLSTASMTEVQDIEGARTYQAARAGIEWGVYQLDPKAASAALPACFSPNPAALTAIPGYSVSVTCTPYPSPATSYQEGSRTIRIFQIVATATSVAARPPGIEREIAVTVEKCRDSTVTSAPYDC